MKRRLGSGKISRDSNPRTRDPKSGALTARPRGRFDWKLGRCVRAVFLPRIIEFIYIIPVYTD